MAKINPLSQGLKQQDLHPDNAQGKPIQIDVQNEHIEHTKKLPPSRAGRVLIGGHFAPEVQTELKILAARERTSIQSLIAEGINAVFARRHKPQIATISPLSLSTKKTN